MTSAAGSQTQQAILYLIQSYHDFNPSTVPVLEASPTPVDFAAYVAASQPVLIRSVLPFLPWPLNSRSHRFRSRVHARSFVLFFSLPPDAVHCSALDWSREAFIERLGGPSQTVQVAVTPDGLVPLLLFWALRIVQPNKANATCLSQTGRLRVCVATQP